MSEITLPLRGAGGEPISFLFSVNSHGLAGLEPASFPADRASYQYRVNLSGRVRTLTFRESKGMLAIGSEGALSKGDLAAVRTIAARMFHLDANLAPFYEMIEDDRELSWARIGAGRMLASPSVFDDIIRTICTTNCQWSGTQRMIEALVELGGGAMPQPAVLAKTPLRWFIERAKMGYRGPYVRDIAKAVVSGKLDPDVFLAERNKDDDPVEEALRGLPGVGPYAAAHIMQLLGYHRRLILDSWTRPKFLRLSGMKRAKDATIERRFARYGPFAGLAFWLYLTRDWHEQQGNL